jgi:hypothetical protein
VAADPFAWLIDAEARAANNEDIDLIGAIFAPDASIWDAAKSEHWRSPLDRYRPFFAAATITGATHTEKERKAGGPGVVHYVSGSSGSVNGASYENRPPSDHWTFGQNSAGCWVITDFAFNASHVDFPPPLPR